MSESVKNYPAMQWNLPGMRPLQVSLIVAVVATSLAGILSNPLFTLANSSITRTPLLKASIDAAVATVAQPQATDVAVLFTDQP